MPSITFVARRPGPFSALVQSAEIGGLRLEPHPPVRVLDRFYDTDDAELLRRGLALRVREQGDQRVVALRALEGDAVAGELSLAADVGPGDDALRLPPSALADTVRRAVGDDALRPLLTLRQYRTPRMAYDGDTPVGVLSFDVVVYEAPGGRVVSNEVEVDPADGADPMGVLGTAFEAHGLEPVAQTKFARGILRQRRTLSQPVLLLPDERRHLETVVASSPDPSMRRRAHVVLLDARGFRPDTIASQTGLSMARVQYWRERFREARLDLLLPGPPTAPVAPVRAPAPVPERPVARPAAERVRPAPVPAPSPAGSAPAGSEGDGMATDTLPGAASALDMADLLDLFSPPPPDTPFLDGVAEAAEDGQGSDPVLEAPTTPPGARVLAAEPLSRNPYPVVLGPVEVAPAPRPAPSTDRRPEDERFDPFSEVDLSQLRRSRRTARIADLSAARRAAPGPAPAAVPAAVPSPPERPRLDGDTPVLVAAQGMMAYAAAAFDVHATHFLASGTPSDARRLLVSAHELRMTAETFGLVLPARAAERLVAALRPLAVDLDDALETARAALAAGDRPDLVRRAADSLAAAGVRLRGGREPWGARAHRLASRLAAQAEAGARISDDAPLLDDFVGAPGDAPAPTRLRHMLGSTVWARFEAVRAVEDDLDAPTPDLAAHLAVALSGLRFVLTLAEPAVGAAVREVSATLEAAERAVVEARRRHRGDDQALDALRDIWEGVTSVAVKKRVAAVVASI